MSIRTRSFRNKSWMNIFDHGWTGIYTDTEWNGWFSFGKTEGKIWRQARCLSYVEEESPPSHLAPQDRIK